MSISYLTCGICYNNLESLRHRVWEFVLRVPMSSPSAVLAGRLTVMGIYYKMHRGGQLWLVGGELREIGRNPPLLQVSKVRWSSGPRLDPSLGWAHNLAQEQATPGEVVEDHDEEGPVEADGEGFRNKLQSPSRADSSLCSLLVQL